MIDRRVFVMATAGLVGALLRIASAQAAGRVYRLGILDLGRAPADPLSPYATTVLLRDLGYVEGQNPVVERRFADGKTERLPGLARELADLRLDAINAIGGAAIRAAKDATTTTPVILLTNGDVVAAGFVQSLARPGANITGVLISPQGTLAGKRLELLRKLVPQARRIAPMKPAPCCSSRCGKHGLPRHRSVWVWMSSRYWAVTMPVCSPRSPRCARPPSSLVRIRSFCATARPSSSWLQGSACPRSMNGQGRSRRVG